MTKVSPVRRNQSAYNLKCLTAFYGLPHQVFCLALSTLDRFITKVKVQPRYLSCITTTCFYHAVKCYQGIQSTTSLEKLIRVSQCDCRTGDILRMETIIQDKLRAAAPDADSVTHLTLLQIIIDVFRTLSGVDLSNHLDKMASKLVMCLCHAELLDVSFVMVALAVFSSHLQTLGIIEPVAFSVVLNICQIADRDFISYQEEIVKFLAVNYAAPSSLPKLQLKWTISNRTMAKLRPGYYGDTGLPVIPELPYEGMERSITDSVESLDDIGDEDDDVPGTPTAEDFNHHFSYPNSPSEPSPLSNGLSHGHILTYADVVSGRLSLYAHE
ncbi:CCNG2 [Bugula neritina]|uniref:CCNG2 n=1 Tax=Bugula neritina TaxID=10212 RepID=A0A7J7JMB5_BUGNE|nr:CCNG2 [Bugula neritina]